MVPMAIPIVGGMIIQIMTIFVVPILQAYWRETVVSRSGSLNGGETNLQVNNSKKFDDDK
jgi:copper/silver efflux system protein